MIGVIVLFTTYLRLPPFSFADPNYYIRYWVKKHLTFKHGLLNMLDKFFCTVAINEFSVQNLSIQEKLIVGDTFGIGYTFEHKLGDFSSEI